MNRIFLKFMSVVLVFAMVTMAIPNYFWGDSLQAASKPSVSSSKKTLYKGKSFNLTIKKSKSQVIKKVTWTSSNKKVVNLKSTKKTSAKVVALKKGTSTVTITIQYCNKGNKKVLTSKRTCKVTVKNVQAVVPTTVPKTKNSEVAISNYDSMASLASKHGFKFGTNINYSSLYDDQFLKLVKHHFNSVTASNEMKAYSLLSMYDSQKDPNGMPVMNYTKADAMMQFAKDNGIQVRGHTLVWDAYMNDWFFKVGFNSRNSYVDSETAKARLKYYIENVITHFEKKYPGVIYCWDVVNEAVGDNASDYVSGDNKHIRKYRNGKDNPFYKTVGDHYVELSFLYAKNTVESLGSNIKLFYNDYNTFYNVKRDAIYNLVTSINSYEKNAEGNYRKLCDGVGMQGYIGGYGQQSGCMNYGDIDLIKNAITKYASLGVEVHVTEMAVRNYKNDAETMARHAKFYEDLFKAFLSLNSGSSKPVTSISIWGLCDNPGMSTMDYSYKMNGPFCGIFDQYYGVKDEFIKINNLLKNGM